jgi:8-oxo-dGTP diphosphatase
MEETGWAISSPLRLGAFRRFTFMPEYDLWAEKICHIYLARPVLRRGPPTEAGHTAVWLSPAAAIVHLASDEDSRFVEMVTRP